jgi:hypothetical protein
MKVPGRSAFGTLYRKLHRSYAHDGILLTLQRCLCTPWNAFIFSIRKLSPRQRRHRSEERNFDRRHNVDTRVRRDAGWMAGIASPNWIHGIGYEPVPAHDISKIIIGLNIDYEKFVFVDLGAGKGRAMLVAAQFPFKRILGVEYSPALASVMKSNIASYINAEQRCFELEGRLQDATECELPEEPLVLFFHHPFEEVIFRQVQHRIEESLAQHPRAILIIYYDPQCGDVFEESSRFGALSRGASDRSSSAAGDWVVYGSCPVIAERRAS